MESGKAEEVSYQHGEDAFLQTGMQGAGEMEIAVSQDREAGFEPRIIRKGQRRFDGFDGESWTLP